jgi:predicted transcriptional regulator
MKTLSIKLDREMAKNLEDKSLHSGKSPEAVLSDMIARYIHYSGWQQDILEFSIEGADHGDFASQEEIASAFLRWGVDTADRPEAPVWSGLGLRAFRKELEHLGKSSPEKAARLARAAWLESTDPGLAKRAFPGMAAISLEVQLADSGYCMAFRELNGKRQIIGIVTGM